MVNWELLFKSMIRRLIQNYRLRKLWIDRRLVFKFYLNQTTLINVNETESEAKTRKDVR